MVVVPAWCPTCNQMVFEPNGMNITARVTIGDGYVTCPRCGGMAQFIQGKFNFTDDFIEIITASPWTRFQLAKFQASLQWAAENYERNPRAAIRRVERASPEAASFLQRMRAPVDRKDVMTFLFGMASLVGVVLANLPNDEATPIPPQQIVQIINGPSLPTDLREQLGLPDPGTPSGPRSEAPSTPAAPETTQRPPSPESR